MEERRRLVQDLPSQNDWVIDPLRGLLEEQNVILRDLYTLVKEAIPQKKKKPEKSDLPPGMPELAQIWNLRRHPDLPAVQPTDPAGKRFKAAKARWLWKPDANYWSGLMVRINSSAFCLGKNDRKWKANFDWFIRPDSPGKILEGLYDRGNKSDGGKVDL